MASLQSRHVSILEGTQENNIKAGIYSRQWQHNVATCNTPTPTLHAQTQTHRRKVSGCVYLMRAHCRVARFCGKQRDAPFRLVTSCWFLRSQQLATCWRTHKRTRGGYAMRRCAHVHRTAQHYVYAGSTRLGGYSFILVTWHSTREDEGAQ